MADDNKEINITDDSPEAGIESLRQQLLSAEDRAKTAEAGRDEERRARDAERQAREEAESRANQASAEIQTGRRYAADAQYDSVINALAASQGELTSAKVALKNAMAEGDFEKVADLSGEIGLIASRVREFENGKLAIEERRRAGTEERQSPQQPSDPKEAYIRSMPPRTASWLRRNDRFFTDSNMQRMVQGAHGLAIGRGMTPESDEYFQFIEEQAGLRQAQSQTPPEPPPPASTTTASTTTQRSSPTPAAPAAGSAQGGTRGTSSGGTITLSPEERDFCRREDIDEVAYAKQKKSLLDEGRIGVGH